MTSSCEAVVRIASVFIGKYFQIVLHMASSSSLKLVGKNREMLESKIDQNVCHSVQVGGSGVLIENLGYLLQPWVPDRSTLAPVPGVC